LIEIGLKMYNNYRLRLNMSIEMVEFEHIIKVLKFVRISNFYTTMLFSLQLILFMYVFFFQSY